MFFSSFPLPSLCSLHAQMRGFQEAYSFLIFIRRAVFLDAGFYISYPYCASRRPVLPVAAPCMHVLVRFSVSRAAFGCFSTHLV